MLFKAKPVASETKNPSMAKPNQGRQLADEKGSPPEAAAWGTWEELLLAYAVNRYGTNSWESISSELRKRSSAAKVFTPKHCRQKYLELERRFDGSIGDDNTATATAAAVPWIEELRKLRVEELQRKLQKFEIYISSLQLKVKKMTEESTDNDCGDRMKKPDLGQKIDDVEIKNVEEVNNKRRNPVKSGEEQVSGDDESEKDNQSVNGSNGNLETGEKSENESSPVYTADEKPESSPHSPAGVEDSVGGRPDAKEPVKTEPESIAGSKSEETIKENSDVQSSASKSRKESSDRVRRGSSKVECDDEDQPYDGIPVRSFPLIDFLQKVHKLGSAVFERRLDRQEKARYKKLIREHIDFEILQTRLKQGRYSDGNKKFFRDLLLLVNNTFVFFSNESPQSIAAIQLRQFILNEMTTSNTKQKTDPKSKPTTPPPKQAPDAHDSMQPKPHIAGSMIVCRKRSSIAPKSSGRKETRIRDGFPPISKKTGKNNVLESRSSGSENSDVKSDGKEMKDKKPGEMEEKRPKFLIRRINRSSSAASNVVAGGGSEDGCGGGEQKRGGEGKKEEAVKRGSGGRQLDSPAKRSVGRPPKKAAAQPPAVAALGKRNRECAESEPLVTNHAKKRSKRFY